MVFRQFFDVKSFYIYEGGNLGSCVLMSQVFYSNSDKFPAVSKDYTDTKTRVEKITHQEKNEKPDSIFKYALEAVPTFRRAASLPDKVDNGDYIATAGALGLALVNIEEDIRDMKSAAKQVYSKINPKYHYDPLYNRNTHQHSFSFTRGIIGEKYLYKKAAEGNPFAEKLLDMDKTIDKTKFGEWINKVFKISEVDRHKVDKIRNIAEQKEYAYKFESSVFGGKTIARAMKRTTLAGVVIMGALELPKIVKETAKGDNLVEHIGNGTKQVLKAAANVAISTVTIGIGGAIGAKYLGASGSLIGMGLGAVASNKFTGTLQKAIG